MTLENARVLYKHRLSLGKSVDDILKRFPELKDEAPPEPVDDVAGVKEGDDDGSESEG